MFALPTSWLLVAAIACLLGAIGPLALWRAPRWGHALGCAASGLASASALTAAVMTLLGAPPTRLALFELYPFGLLTLQLDALGSVFLGLTGALGLAVSIYAVGYARHYEGRKHLGLLASLVAAFLFAMGLVPLAAHALTFLAAWELMAVVSFLLVAFNHEHEATRRAAIMYAVMTHLGAGFLIAAFLIFGTQAHSFDFEAWRRVGPLLPGLVPSSIFVLALIGFGTKAGVLPLHGWLPEAHPAAPAHVSALMSGAMIKTGLYGLIRLAFDLLGGGPAWWGLTVLSLGAVTAVMGALYAVAEGDLKRLLAYSSIENVGIALLGVGAALYFKATHHAPLAALALVAALLHLVNHAGFKGLMFLGAGAVQFATHTVRLDDLGGLIRKMPRTAFFVLIGTLAITAMPPLNGFVGEWLTYQALFSGLWLKDPVAGLALPLAACALALTAGLALVAFVKAYAVAFLAKGRSPQADHAAEVPVSMQVGMGTLAIACLALGLTPALVVPVLGRVAGPLVGAAMPTSNAWLLVPVKPEVASLSTPLLAAVLAALVVSGWLLARVLGGRTRSRVGPTWACGWRIGPRNQVTAAGYAQPLRTIFGRLLMPHAQEVQADPTVPAYFKRDMRYALYFESVVDKYLYEPATRCLLAASRQMTRLQAGSIHLYLTYIFVSLLAVLLLMKGLG